MNPPLIVGVPIPKSVIEKTQPQRPPTLTEQVSY